MGHGVRAWGSWAAHLEFAISPFVEGQPGPQGPFLSAVWSLAWAPSQPWGLGWRPAHHHGQVPTSLTVQTRFP